VQFSKFLRICDTELLSLIGTDKNDLILIANRQTGDITAYGIINVQKSNLPPEQTCSELTGCLLNPLISVFSEHNSSSANQEIPGIV